MFWWSAASGLTWLLLFQVKPSAQVDALCAETVDRILLVLEQKLEKQKNSESEERDTVLGERDDQLDLDSEEPQESRNFWTLWSF